MQRERASGGGSDPTQSVTHSTSRSGVAPASVSFPPRAQLRFLRSGCALVARRSSAMTGEEMSTLEGEARK
jgi:hypothetical protein